MDAHDEVPTPAATRRDRNRQRVKERVYASAMTLISQKGYAGASVEEIAEHADVARGTFFNHFPRKEALINAWAEARRERLMERLEQAGLEQRRPGQGPADRPGSAEGLRQCLAVLGALNEEEPELSRAMLTAWVRTGRPLEEEPYLGAILAELVETGRARGEIATGLSSEQVGEALRDLYLGALYRWTRRAARGEDPGRLTGELVSVLDLVLHGLAARERPAGTGHSPN
ncbi:TetR/AcrR family transcriptional regulator [Kitasatospora sp. NPDC101155]|uniref:TetR/AcrR family transcriptional regulator n=1 Tax=Kitasatospora sp. NPDC101155 TaxID=3364097 RepID=UPI003826F7C8